MHACLMLQVRELKINNSALVAHYGDHALKHNKGSLSEEECEWRKAPNPLQLEHFSFLLQQDSRTRWILTEIVQCYPFHYTQRQYISSWPVMHLCEGRQCMLAFLRACLFLECNVTP